MPLITEDARAVWGWAWLDTLAQDVRLALRLTGRAPGFTTLCVLVLAFGIGASTTLYAVIYEVIVRPLPYAEPSRVVRVSEERPGAAAPIRDALLSNLTFHAWRDVGVESLTGLAGYEPREHAVTLPDLAACLLPGLAPPPASRRACSAANDAVTAPRATMQCRDPDRGIDADHRRGRRRDATVSTSRVTDPRRSRSSSIRFRRISSRSESMSGGVGKIRRCARAHRVAVAGARAYTDRPRERVSSTAMCSRSAGSAINGFRSRTTRSACFPTVIEPLVSSSKYW